MEFTATLEMARVDLTVLPHGKHEWIPTHATPGSAGLDLRAAIHEPILLYPGACKRIPSGIAIHIRDPNWFGMVVPRSGLGSKHGIVIGNLTGVIDADYTGEIGITAWNRNHEGLPYTINPGDRIAQLLLVPVSKVHWNIVDSLQDTTRGSGGFGSTGVS